MCVRAVSCPGVLRGHAEDKNTGEVQLAHLELSSVIVLLLGVFSCVGGVVGDRGVHFCEGVRV